MEHEITSKELVQRAVNRTSPSRLPICYCNRDFEYSDVFTVGYKAARSFVPDTPRLSEWGYIWEVLDGTMGQPTACPLQDWNRIDAYAPPDPLDRGRLCHVPGDVAHQQDKFLRLGMGITGFNQATFLRGFEEFLADLYTQPKHAERVLDIVFGFENSLIGQSKDLGLDCVAFWDDWGMQKGLIISPDKWRQVFKARYAKQFELVHACGMNVWFHSCGDVREIIGDLIDIGADVIELLQPDLLGIDCLSDQFGGRVCFCCSVDHQRTAILGTKSEIFDYARRLYEKLACFNGGFIAYIEDYSCLGMSEANYQWIREAFHSL